MNQSFGVVRAAFAVSAALGLTPAAMAQCTMGPLTANDPEVLDGFGFAVATDGPWAIIGAPFDDEPGVFGSGSVRVFERTGLSWQHVQRLRAPDFTAYSRFGSSVAMDGDWAVVGAPGTDVAGVANCGAAYVYRRVNGIWSFHSTLSVRAQDRISLGYFGDAVAMRTNRLVVGMPGHQSSGAAYVYVFGGASWILQNVIKPAGLPIQSAAGRSVAITQGSIALGAPFAGGDDKGRVYLFSEDANGWFQAATIQAPNGVAGDQFGDAVGLSEPTSLGTYLMVGAPRRAHPGGEGHLYVYRRTGGVSTLVGQATSQGSGALGFAQCISVSRDLTHGVRFAVGSQSTQGASWIQPFTISASGFFSAEPRHLNPTGTSIDGFGQSVAYGDVVLAGAYEASTNGQNMAGLVYPLIPSAHTDVNCLNLTELNDGVLYGCSTSGLVGGGATCGNSSTTPSMFYKYTAPCSGIVDFSLAGSAYDTVLSVYDQCQIDGSTLIACNDDAAPGDLTSRTSAYLTSGQTVIVRVSGYSGATGPFMLTISRPPVSNDICSGAIAVSEGDHPFSTCNATRQEFPGAANVGLDVWFSYRPSCSGIATFSTCDGPGDVDDVLQLWDVCPSGAQEIPFAYSDDDCGWHPRIDAPVTAGQLIFIRAGMAFGNVTRFDSLLHISVAPARCAADYNQDGGVDGADVDAFFGEWESGAGCADANQDGGVDGADVDTFFEVWEAGGC